MFALRCKGGKSPQVMMVWLEFYLKRYPSGELTYPPTKAGFEDDETTTFEIPYKG